ncbi:26S proteasome non-ATPase regulatory subunit [Musa troglodytarum]|uniref:non-specific serine/threonine protein kinase n=1 Tax=Musa troglodytarum TaxID=320322 RepID=A0A9E7FXE2_9LILI|nr:26S proteasome non-ATPase regulatory subunit [Musa troglodytarum]
MAKPISIEVWNPSGKYRIVSTKSMPGTRWIRLLTDQDCRVEICTEKKTILSVEDILALIGNRCNGLTEDWGEVLFSALKRAGGSAFSNMAVGYNNVDVNAANKYGIAVGNTPGVLTETTAELAASLSLAAARRIVEADQFMRAGLYDGWLPHLFVGNLLKGQTVGVIGAGRIGSAYARMMANGEQPVTWKRAASMEDVLREADVISLHPVLDKTTYHLVNKERLAIMKKEAILVNASRGPVIDEAALVEHLKANPMFRVGLDVFEGKIKGYPIWGDPNQVVPFLDENSPAPAACPSIINAKQLESFQPKFPKALLSVNNLRESSQDPKGDDLGDLQYSTKSRLSAGVGSEWLPVHSSILLALKKEPRSVCNKTLIGSLKERDRLGAANLSIPNKIRNTSIAAADDATPLRIPGSELRSDATQERRFKRGTNRRNGRRSRSRAGLERAPDEGSQIRAIRFERGLILGRGGESVWLLSKLDRALIPPPRPLPLRQPPLLPLPPPSPGLKPTKTNSDTGTFRSRDQRMKLKPSVNTRRKEPPPKAAAHRCREPKGERKRTVEKRMAVIEGEKHGESRCIMVGLQMNAKGKEVLDWAIHKVAEQGDRVMAVQVCRDSAPLAKYCAKNLPPTTALIAVRNGNVVFERGAAKPSQGEFLQTLRPTEISRWIRNSWSVVSEELQRPQSLRNLLYPSEARAIRKPEEKTVVETSRSPDSNHVKGEIVEAVLSSVTVLMRHLPEPVFGWPLLKKKAAPRSIEVKRANRAWRLSVVRRVMNLPPRTLSSAQPLLQLIEELNSVLENLIGKGGSSRVYRGRLGNGQQVAIKLSKLSPETSKDFLSEVDIITKLKHLRVVPLLGICVEEHTLVSVYRYFPNGSLEQNLHGDEMKHLLPWERRFRVGTEIAEALSYLHHGCRRPVIHRDVKSSNILLNDEFEPQLSDFGLAMWAPTAATDLTQSDVVGTFGYLAPEYLMYGKVSNKNDVYAFGVVLLELLTGRKPIDDGNPKGEESLVMWVRPLSPSRPMDVSFANQARKMFPGDANSGERGAHRSAGSQSRLLKGEEDMETWISSQADGMSEVVDCPDDEAYPTPSLALLDVDDDASVASVEQSHCGSWEAYLRRRWSRSSSFN